MGKLLLLVLLLSTLTFANVGKVTTVKGDVTLKRDSQNIPVKTGLVLQEQDTINTSNNGRVQLIFNDQTIISLGKNSNFSIHEYLYDIKTPTDTKANFSVSQGIFKAITGQIGKINPSKFKLKTKSASIGIRGTVFFGDVQPGQAEIIVCTQGSITVETPNGTVTIKAGEFTKIEAGKAPTPPAPISKEQMQQLEQKSGVTKKETIQEVPDQKDSGENAEEVKKETVNEAVTFTVQNSTQTSSSTTPTVHYYPISPTGYFPEINSNEYSLVSDSDVTDKLGTGWVAQLTDSCDSYDWGYWGTGTFDDTMLSHNSVEKVWVKAKEAVTDITTLSGTATYSGSILGYTYDSSITSRITSGSITLNFDFGANTAGVNMTVNGSSNYSISQQEYTVSDNGYYLSDDSSNYVSGKIYDSGASTAGKFSIQNSQQPTITAKGVYRANKQVSEVSPH